MACRQWSANKSGQSSESIGHNKVRWQLERRQANRVDLRPLRSVSPTTTPRDSNIMTTPRDSNTMTTPRDSHIVRPRISLEISETGAEHLDAEQGRGVPLRHSRPRHKLARISSYRKACIERRQAGCSGRLCRSEEEAHRDCCFWCDACSFGLYKRPRPGVRGERQNDVLTLSIAKQG